MLDGERNSYGLNKNTFEKIEGSCLFEREFYRMQDSTGEQDNDVSAADKKLQTTATV